MSTSLVTFGLLAVTCAAVVGISHSMAPSVALLGPLMGHSTWRKELARTSIATVTLKATVMELTRAECKWDSGLESASLLKNLPTLILAGIQWCISLLRKWRKLNSKHDTCAQLDFTRVEEIDLLETKKRTSQLIEKQRKPAYQYV